MVDSYNHEGKKRLNNPPVGLVDSDTEPEPEEKKTYQYDPHLDPQLDWAGKAEQSVRRCSAGSREEGKTREGVPPLLLHIIPVDLSEVGKPGASPPLQKTMNIIRDLLKT